MRVAAFALSIASLLMLAQSNAQSNAQTNAPANGKADAKDASQVKVLVPGTPSPAAKIEELAWLAGEWRVSDSSGNSTTETYSSPVAQQMAGHAVQVNGNKLAYHEFMTVVERNGTLAFRLKHFDTEMVGWEEKADKVEVPLVAKGENVWYFDGLTIRRDGPTKMVSIVRVTNPDGTTQANAFRYDRVR